MTAAQPDWAAAGVDAVRNAPPEPEPESRPAARQWPAPLGDPAYYGILGDLTHRIAPTTEADPAGILMQLVVAAGNAIGHGPHFMIEATPQAANLNVILVGDTSLGRKGTAKDHALRCFRLALGSSSAHEDAGWLDQSLASGLSSGEGVIWQVRDKIEREEEDKKTGKSHVVVVDQGTDEKRALFVETEYARVLRVARRDGNILPYVLSQAFDSGTLRLANKNTPAFATGAHISTIGHITPENLVRHLDDDVIASGFANRSLFVLVRRARLLPDGERLPDAAIWPLTARLGQAIAIAKGRGELTRDVEARRLWHEMYGPLTTPPPGLLGALQARGPAIVMRIALVVALLDDGATRIGWQHLAAAGEVWRYSCDSTVYIFGDRLGDPVADQLLQGLRSAPAGLTRTEIRDLFGRNLRAGEVERALGLLLVTGLAQKVEGAPSGPGRPPERWVATGGNDRNDRTQDFPRFWSCMSFRSYQGDEADGVTTDSPQTYDQNDRNDQTLGEADLSDDGNDQTTTDPPSAYDRNDGNDQTPDAGGEWSA